MATYEWDIETIDLETEEVLDHNHADTLAEFVKRGHGKLAPNEVLVLVRDCDRLGRSWAYAKNTEYGPMMALSFRDAYDEKTVNVPTTFGVEFKKHMKDFY